VGIFAFMGELGKNVGLELHSLIHYEQHTGGLTICGSSSNLTHPVCNKGLKCLYVEMAEYLIEQLVVVSQWLSLRSTGVLEMVFDLSRETDWSSSVVYLKTATRYSCFFMGRFTYAVANYEFYL
jgi:hypothetical protein